MPGLTLFSAPWFFAIAVVLIAGFIRGTAGFGFALVFAPIALLFIEPKAVVPVNLLLGFLSNIIVLAYSYKMVNVRHMLPMVAGSLLGVPLGIFIITIISAVLLKVLIGGVTVFFAILMVLNLTPHFSRERPVSFGAGFLSGILTSSTSLGGPPVVLFMHTQKWERKEIHPSLSAYFMFSTTISLIGLLISGVITPGIILTTLTLAPALFLGVFLGMQAFRHVNERIFRIICMVVIIVSGIMAVLSGLGALG